MAATLVSRSMAARDDDAAVDAWLEIVRHRGRNTDGAEQMQEESRDHKTHRHAETRQRETFHDQLSQDP